MKGLILTYIIAVGSSIWALRYPVIGLLTYVGFAVLRPQAIFGFAGDIRNVSQWVGIALIAGWVINGFGTWKFGRARGVVIVMFLFVGWFILSGIQALNPDRSYESLVNLSRFMLPVLIGITLLDDTKNRHRMFWTIVMAQGYVGFEMNLMYLKGYNVAADGFGGMDNNCFAASLVATIGPAVCLVIASKTWWERALAGSAAALILHTLLLTFSRGGMVGLLAVGVVALVMMPKRPKYMAVVVLTMLLAVRLTGPQLMARYASTFAETEERDGSAESRLDLWRDCLKVVADYPILGVGPANWRVIASSYGWPEGKSAHSVWMETAAEMGIPGSLLLFSFFGIAAIRLWPIARLRQTDENRLDIAIAAGTVLSAVGFIVSGQFVSVSGLELPYYVVMVGAGLLKHGVPVAKATEPAPAARRAPNLHPAVAELMRQNRPASGTHVPAQMRRV
jgi:putative inorganic carbon (hco3(-)) transporter